jgi:hypothetical protein
LRYQAAGVSSTFAAGTAAGTAGRTAGRHGMSTTVAGTGNSIETGKESFNFRRLAVGTGDPVIRGSEDQLFKFRLTLQTLVFKYGHGFLNSIACYTLMVAQTIVVSQQSAVRSLSF